MTPARALSIAIVMLVGGCDGANGADAGMDAAVCPNGAVLPNDPCTPQQEGLMCASPPVATCDGGATHPLCTCTHGSFQCPDVTCHDGG